MVKAGSPKDAPLPTFEMNFGSVEFHLLGNSPLILHAFSAKAKRSLLMPTGRMTTAEKAANVKHNPHQEYIDSTYRQPGEDVATRLVFPTTGFKAAMSEAAIEYPGATSKTIDRLVWVEGEYVEIYGIPELHMDTVRMQDIAKTPDIRTRAIVPHWGCKVKVRYAQPKVTGQVMLNLLQVAGMIIGIGDKRQGKGVGNHGQWNVVEADNASLQAIIQNGGREAQDAALREPALYDENTADLYNWWHEQMAKKDDNVQKLHAVA